MEVKPGYKLTDVGVTPEDWRVSPLEEFTSFISYGFTNPMPTSESGFYMITARDINHGRIQFDTARCTTEEAYRTLLTAKSRPKKGDLLLTKDGTLGRLALVDERTVCINQSVAILRPNSKSVAQFLKVLLEAPTYQNRMLEDAGGSTIKHIYITIVNRMPLAVPPTKAEQEAIAVALNDADALIEFLDQLITKKRDLKQGAMQELLTGMRRLPGFESNPGYKQTELGVLPEDWGTAALGNLTLLMTNGFVGTATRHYASNDNGVLYIQGYNVEENSFNFRGIKYVTEDFHRAHMKSCLRAGDLLTVQTGEVGLTTIVPGSLAGANCHALIISRFDQNSVSPAFISYYLNSNPGRSRLRLIETGTTMKHLNVGDVLQFLIPLPPTKAEQTAIAAILSDMDAEIAALEAKLAKARSMKQGMMQELLTGRIRLV
jgi:type I restriction enzyme, S subunit